MLQGNLKEHFFPDLLVHIYRSGRTGVLSVTRERVKKEIFLREGVPILARSNVKRDQLSDLLVAGNIITAAESEAGRALQESAGIDFSEALLKQGAIREDTLFTMKRRQFLHVIYSLFALKEGAYSFDERELAREVKGYEVSLPSLITFGIRRILDVRYLRGLIGDLDQIPVPTARFLGHRRIKFTVPELAVIHQIDGTRGLQQIISASRVQPSDVIKTVLILSCLGYVKFHIDFREEKVDELVVIDEDMEKSLGFQTRLHDNLDEEQAVAGNSYLTCLAGTVSAVAGTGENDLISSAAEAFGFKPDEPLRTDAVQAAILDSLDDDLVAETAKTFGTGEQKAPLSESGSQEDVTSLDEDLVAQAESIFGLNKEGRHPALKEELSGDPPEASETSSHWMDSILNNENSDFATGTKETAEKSWEEEILGKEAVWPGEEVSSDEVEAVEEPSPFSTEQEKTESGEADREKRAPVEADKPGFRELAEANETLRLQGKKKKYFLEGALFLLLGFSAGLFLLFRDGSFLGSINGGVPGETAQNITKTSSAIPGTEEAESVPPLPDWVLEHDADPLMAKADNKGSHKDDEEKGREPAAVARDREKAAAVTVAKEQAPAQPKAPVTPPVAPEPAAEIAKTPAPVTADPKDGAPQAKVVKSTAPARILALATSTGDDHERVTIELDSPIDFKKYALPEQRMVFVSLRNARFDRGMSLEPVQVDSGYVKQVRMGQYKPKLARVVLDGVESKDVSVAAERNPDRIIITVKGGK